MSDIIIEGKNLDDINQSNFQTVGVRSSFYAPTNDFGLTAGPEGVVTLQTQGNLSFNFPNDFRFGTLEDHANRFGQLIDAFGEFGFLLKNTTVEPWQGRLHYDYEITNLNEQYFNFVKLFQQLNVFGDIKYPYFYTGDVYAETSRLKFTVEDTFERVEQQSSLTEKFTFIDPPGQNLPQYKLSRDSRFSLGTYTENNKQYWERQTSDPRTRKSQFPRSKMRTAFGELLNISGSEPVIVSDEEQFSVDAFVFTDRESKRTPLCFYYDKNLHSSEYRLATNGKVKMQIELRASGRDIFNQIDLYSERKAFRPFRLGFVKEEQDGGRGDVYGEGLYTAGDNVKLTADPSDDSYMLGIFDSDDILKSQNETFSFIMPEQDVEYQARFRPNPILKIKTRYIDPDDGTFKYDAGDESKGKLKVYASKNDYDSNDEEWSTVSLVNGGEPDYSPIGEDLEVDTFRPTSFGGSQYTVKQEEVTNNYSFQGFTYLSSSNEEIELPTSEQPGADLDLSTLQQKRQKSFDIKEHFRYPLLNNERVFEIYATYKTAMFTIENFNNSIDFENGSFEDAMIYGPVKWAVRKAQGSDDVRYDDLVEFPIFESNDGNIQRLLIEGPGDVVDPPVINQPGYALGVFQVFQPNLSGELILQSEIADVIIEQVPITYQSAKEYNGGQEPPASQGPTTQAPQYQVGDTFGLDGVFILNSVEDDSDQSDQDDNEQQMVIYNYTWGGNPDVLNGVLETYEQIYKLTDFERIQQGYVGVRLVGDIDDNTGLLNPSGASTPVIGQEIVSQIRYVPLQLGTYVECKLSGGVETTFELTNVGPDEIVRPKADSGVINANMFNFGEQVRFQITPNEPAEQPLFNVFVWDDENSTLKNINDDDINLTKEQLGVTFDWNGGGNFGTLNYNMPDSRTNKILIGGVEYPVYFKYIEFRFTVPQEEDFDGNEGGDEQVDDEFHARLSAIDIPGTGGQIRLEDNTVLGTGNAALDLFPTEDGDFSELTVEQRTIRLRAVPTSGIAEGEWSVLADPGVNTNTIGIINQVSGPGSSDDVIDFTINGTGDITISYNWSGDDSEGGP